MAQLVSWEKTGYNIIHLSSTNSQMFARCVLFFFQINTFSTFAALDRNDFLQRS